MKVNLHPHKDLPGWYMVDFWPNGANGERVRIYVSGYQAAVARKKILEATVFKPVKAPCRNCS